MEWVETTGRTVEEAKDAALDQLGVAEEDAEFQVIEEPRPGLFGRVRGEARVRARVRPTQPRPKEDRRDRRRRSRSGARTSETRQGDGRPADQADDEAPAQQDDEREEEMSDHDEDLEDVSLEEQAEEAVIFVRGLVERFQLHADVDSQVVDDENIEIRVDGSDLGLLIGPKGATLGAIQELTRTVVQRRLRARHGRILVDVSGYRQKRKVALERFTNEVAAQVKATGTRRVLEPMPPADRKIVHETVNQIDGVTTTSEGEEPRRRVVILPQP